MNIPATELVLRVAGATIGASEVPPSSNRGPFVERALATCGLPPGQPWCAAWVAHIGLTALGELWPVVRTGGCQLLHDWATKRGVLVATPNAGDIFLIWYPALGRFAHTGFVARVLADGTCVTREGNTSGEGVREGWLVAERTRRFKPADRFIRWADLVEERL